MSKRKGASKKQKLNFSEYQVGCKAQLNRTLRLDKHCKKFPEDKQSKRALKNGLALYRRYASRHSVWSATSRHFAQLFVKAGLNGNDALPKKEFSKT